MNGNLIAGTSLTAWTLPCSGQVPCRVRISVSIIAIVCSSSYVGRSRVDCGGRPAEAGERDRQSAHPPGHENREVAPGDAGAAGQEGVAERGDEVLEREGLRDLV